MIIVLLHMELISRTDFKKEGVSHFGTGSSKPVTTGVHAGKTAVSKVPKPVSRPSSKKEVQGVVKPTPLKNSKMSVDNTDNAAAASRREEMEYLDFRKRVAETVQEESRAAQSKIKTYDEGYEFARKLFADAVKVSVGTAAVGTAAYQADKMVKDQKEDSSNLDKKEDSPNLDSDRKDCSQTSSSSPDPGSGIPNNIGETKFGEETPPNSGT